MAPVIRKSLRPSFRTVCAFCTILGLIALWPRVVVEPIGQIEPSDPHPIIFRITNTGFIPLWNLLPGFGLCSLDIISDPAKPTNPQGGCQHSLESILVRRDWFVSVLARDEHTEIRLDDLFDIKAPAKLGYADISVVLSFNPWFFPKTKKLEYRYYTRVEKDGKLSWVPRPLDK